jgi:hypothetical protein
MQIFKTKWLAADSAQIDRAIETGNLLEVEDGEET